MVRAGAPWAANPALAVWRGATDLTQCCHRLLLLVPNPRPLTPWVKVLDPSLQTVLRSHTSLALPASAVQAGPSSPLSHQGTLTLTGRMLLAGGFVLRDATALAPQMRSRYPPSVLSDLWSSP